MTKVAFPIAPILMGTTAINLIGDPYYGKLAQSCTAKCIPLPRAGMMHIPDAAKQLAECLEQFRQPDGKLKLITHSQGALIGVLHADAYPDTEVLAFGGPFRGAPSAQMMCIFPKCIRRAVPALRDMSPRSRFMAEFAEVLERNASCLTSVATTHDRMSSAPATSSSLPRTQRSSSTGASSEEALRS
jgi:pimeloyl-ACP methyl ester carboxylesterase